MSLLGGTLFHLNLYQMKHYHSLFICLMLVLLSACQSRGRHYIIGVSQCSNDEWRTQMNKEILREAHFYDGLKVDIKTANDNTRQQESDINDFIKQKVDLLVISPNQGSELTPVVEKAFDAGIPVILVDRKILSQKYTAFIGADNEGIGKAVAYYVANMLKARGKVAEISGLKGSTPAIERDKGFSEALSSYPQIKLVSKEDAGWLKLSAEKKMHQILAQHPDIKLVYAQNDRMAAGAYDAACKMRKEKDIVFIGTDALSGKGYGLEMVNQGKLAATFIYPTGGDKVIQTAIDILNKRPFSRERMLTTAVIDKNNAHVMSLQANQINELDEKIEKLNNRIGIYLIRYSNQQIVLYGSLIILLLVAGLLIVAFKALRSKNRMNLALSQQKQQLEEQRDKLAVQRDQLIQLSQQLEEATHAKLVFFTNISHDFRTPLTLIADPVELLLNDKTMTDHQHELLSLAQRNVKILLRLVGQILDFRKYENGKMEFHPVSLDVLNCLNTWNAAFSSMALHKHIHFSFNYAPSTDYHTLADLEKLQSIYFNLLSNAFKFVPENGKVAIDLSLQAKETGEYIRFTVANTGSLIDAEHIRSIFDRFYQAGSHHAGSGIGLALVKAFVDMHGGHISVESDEKKGTIFIVDIPHRVVNDDVVLSQQSVDEVSSVSVEDEDNATEEEDYDSEKMSVLVIDDNADIRSYVASLLKNEYSVLQAANGKEGIQKAMKYVPNLIICDVMMPGIDGIECCRRLKNELQTCHIPIILLTACALDEKRIEGYDGGADSYISKPFSSPLLLARIHNLISSHEKLKEAFSDGQMPAVKVDICDMDKDFLEKFRQLIDSKMNDSELNVEELGSKMGLSRVQLYRKIKSLTNYSPNEFLRVARLKRANALLASSQLSIAEICYEVGFSSPSYFTKCYKEQYGESPTDFLKRKNN